MLKQFVVIYKDGYGDWRLQCKPLDTREDADKKAMEAISGSTQKEFVICEMVAVAKRTAFIEPIKAGFPVSGVDDAG